MTQTILHHVSVCAGDILQLAWLLNVFWSVDPTETKQFSLIPSGAAHREVPQTPFKNSGLSAEEDLKGSDLDGLDRIWGSGGRESGGRGCIVMLQLFLSVQGETFARRDFAKRDLYKERLLQGETFARREFAKRYFYKEILLQGETFARREFARRDFYKERLFGY